MQLEQVIKEFGESVGFQSLEINSNGVVHMTITKVGDLLIKNTMMNLAEMYLYIFCAFMSVLMANFIGVH